jgi:exonuclease III
MGNRRQAMKISSLNSRFLKKHIEDILSDGYLLNSDIICLQETWLQEDAISEDLQIPNFKSHLNSNGKGKEFISKEASSNMNVI